jgi:hypothetical protein
MSCWRAGQVFDRPDWQHAARALIQAAVAAQQPGGYWAEHGGPTTLYNLIYVHALGLYHLLSSDPSVLPAVEAAVEFHDTFLYPDGFGVETVDGRVKYHHSVHPAGLVAFSLCPKGRRLARYVLERLEPTRDLVTFQGGALVSAWHHLRAGDEAPITLDQCGFRKTYRDWAVTTRQGPWFAALSAYTAPPVASRWGQDRQAFVSLWHQEAGLVVGGGNSKDQPEWSTFVAEGRFVPERGELLAGGDGIMLTYGRVRCRLRLELTPVLAVLEAAAENGPAVFQMVVQAQRGQPLVTAGGRRCVVGDDALDVSGPALGDWLEVAGCRIRVPRNARFRWPTVPFNPYAIDGAAPFGSERAVLSGALEQAAARWEFTARA